MGCTPAMACVRNAVPIAVVIVHVWGLLSFFVTTVTNSLTHHNLGIMTYVAHTRGSIQSSVCCFPGNLFGSSLSPQRSTKKDTSWGGITQSQTAVQRAWQPSIVQLVQVPIPFPRSPPPPPPPPPPTSSSWAINDPLPALRPCCYKETLVQSLLLLIFYNNKM